jgi:hypothetical protein
MFREVEERKPAINFEVGWNGKLVGCTSPALTYYSQHAINQREFTLTQLFAENVSELPSPSRSKQELLQICKRQELPDHVYELIEERGLHSLRKAGKTWLVGAIALFIIFEIVIAVNFVKAAATNNLNATTLQGLGILEGVAIVGTVVLGLLPYLVMRLCYSKLAKGRELSSENLKKQLAQELTELEEATNHDNFGRLPERQQENVTNAIQFLKQFLEIAEVDPSRALVF